MISLRFFVSWLVFAKYWVSNNRTYDEESIYFLTVSSISRGLRSVLPYVFFCTWVFLLLIPICNLFVFFFCLNISRLFELIPKHCFCWILTIVLLSELLRFLGRDFLLIIVLFDHRWLCSFTGIFLLLCCLIFSMKDIGWLFLLFSSPEDSLLQFCGHLILIKCLHI